jgi:rod shape determining protein RodA
MAMLEPSQSQRYHSRWRDLDPFMPITTLVLFGFGLLAIYSADNRQIGINALAVRQLIYAGIGVALMITFTVIDYRQLRSLAVPIYLGAVALIALVMPLGTIRGGARRWFDLKVMTFQPSEPGKLAVIVALAAFIAWRGPGMRKPLSFLATGLLIAVPAALIFEEPDLGTALVYAAIWCGMIAVARTRFLYLFATGVATVPIAYFAWHYLLHDYQKQRLLIFRQPEMDIQGAGFNIIQARITIGQAGLIGHRFADTGHTDYQLLAVSTTDFAFAHAIGNFGFIGAVALFVLFLILIWRYLRVATLARDEFGQLLAIGAASMLFFQTFVNIGMNEGVLPVTGIPLPFISYGGSPMITLLAIQGILQSILIHREKLTF